MRGQWGAGSVVLLPSGRWRLFVRAGNQRVTRTVDASTRDEALRLLEAFRKETRGAIVPMRPLRDLDRLPDPGEPDGVVPVEGWVVYSAVDADGSVLYVGMTSDLLGRMASWRSAKTWWPLAANIEIRRCASKDEANRLEYSLVALHEPPYNVAKRLHVS